MPVFAVPAPPEIDKVPVYEYPPLTPLTPVLLYLVLSYFIILRLITDNNPNVIIMIPVIMGNG